MSNVKYTPISVVYKTPRAKKARIKTFDDVRTPDRIITNRSNLLPSNSDILEIGVGEVFQEKYKKKYKL